MERDGRARREARRDVPCFLDRPRAVELERARIGHQRLPVDAVLQRLRDRGRLLQELHGRSLQADGPIVRDGEAGLPAARARARPELERRLLRHALPASGVARVSSDPFGGAAIGKCCLYWVSDHWLAVPHFTNVVTPLHSATTTTTTPVTPTQSP
jgi:hypothetical protein